MLEIDIHRDEVERILCRHQPSKLPQPQLDPPQPQELSTAVVRTMPKQPTATVPRSAADVAQRRRRRERMLVARWDASTPARAELAPALATLRSARQAADHHRVESGTRVWVKGYGKGTYLCGPAGRRAADDSIPQAHFIEFDSWFKRHPFVRRQQVDLKSVAWGVLPPRELELLIRQATCVSSMARLAAADEQRLLPDSAQLGSVQHACNVKEPHTLSRRALANRASDASAALDVLCGLSRRAKRHAKEKSSWRARSCNRWHVDPNELSFPIPSAAAANAVAAAKRRLKDIEDIAAAAWEAAERSERRSKYSSEDSDRDDGRPTGSFEALRHAMLVQHRPQLQRDLGNETVFTPVPLAAAPRNAFMRTYAGSDVAFPTAAYHGTRASNFRSIEQLGLVVPGSSHGVKVANGSAHGVGIYTAKLGKHHLSLNFSDSGELLVCGIVDTPEITNAKNKQRKRLKFGAGRARGHRVTSRPQGGPGWPHRQQMMGRLPLHRDGREVRHVGDAMVIFQNERVAPLFVAKPSSPRLHRYHRGGGWRVPQDPNEWWKKGNPNQTKSSVDGSQHTRQVALGGEVLFLPPGPVEWYGRHAKAVKRRQVARVRDVARRRARLAKRKPTLLLDLEESLSLESTGLR